MKFQNYPRPNVLRANSPGTNVLVGKCSRGGRGISRGNCPEGQEGIFPESKYHGANTPYFLLYL